MRYDDQSAQLKRYRTNNPHHAQTSFSSSQATLRRLTTTCVPGASAFFRRMLCGEQVGARRFKARDRFDTVEVAGYGDGDKLTKDRVSFQHNGNVRISLHRPIQRTIKTLSLTQGRPAALMTGMRSCRAIRGDPFPCSATELSPASWCVQRGAGTSERVR
ncbi:MAG: hypothetical protein M3R24_41075 [Chloroflexota bacterium]|nr:hypothetical protein [Chloroflexota bacterium]